MWLVIHILSNSSKLKNYWSWGVTLSEKFNVRCDKMMETRLKENSQKLDISIFDLVDRYIRRGVYSDNHYLEKPRLSFEQLKEISRKDSERDRKNGIFPKSHTDSLVGICNKDD